MILGGGIISVHGRRVQSTGRRKVTVIEPLLIDAILSETMIVGAAHHRVAALLGRRRSCCLLRRGHLHLLADIFVRCRSRGSLKQMRHIRRGAYARGTNMACRGTTRVQPDCRSRPPPLTGVGPTPPAPSLQGGGWGSGRFHPAVGLSITALTGLPEEAYWRSVPAAAGDVWSALSASQLPSDLRLPLPEMALSR